MPDIRPVPGSRRTTFDLPDAPSTSGTASTSSGARILGGAPGLESRVARPSTSSTTAASAPRVQTSLLGSLWNSAASLAAAAATQAQAYFIAPEPPPSTHSWAATPGPGDAIDIGDARPLGTMQDTAGLPEDVRACARDALRELPGLQGFLGRLSLGEEIMDSRQCTPEERRQRRAQGLPTDYSFQTEVKVPTGKFNLDVHQAECFLGGAAHGDLVRLPLDESLPRDAYELVEAGKRLAPGVGVPRLACFTRPPGSDEVHFRVGTKAVSADEVVSAAASHGKTSNFLERLPRESPNVREWRSFPIGNGFHLVPSLARHESQAACEMMVRKARGERLGDIAATFKRAYSPDFAQRWEQRTGGKERPVQVPRDPKSPPPAASLVRDLRHKLHEHGPAILAVTHPERRERPRHLVLFDIQMQDEHSGTAIVADPDTATVTSVAFGPDQPSLLPLDVREDGQRLAASFFTRDPAHAPS